MKTNFHEAAEAVKKIDKIVLVTAIALLAVVGLCFLTLAFG